ncbi:hypothetical protein BH18ACI1_BH18ACI1_11660 [soil metagenome]
MSKNLVLQIPDDVFEAVEQVAAKTGATAEKFVLEIVLRNLPHNKKMLTVEERRTALAKLMNYAGAVEGDSSRSGDNELIDADLAREYGKDL